jgi:hypothetical protein
MVLAVVFQWAKVPFADIGGVITGFLEITSCCSDAIL